MPHWKVFNFASMAEYSEFLENHPHYIHLVDEDEMDVEPNWNHLQLLCTKKHRKDQHRPGCSRDEKFPRYLPDKDPEGDEVGVDTSEVSVSTVTGDCSSYHDHVNGIDNDRDLVGLKEPSTTFKVPLPQDITNVEVNSSNADSPADKELKPEFYPNSISTYGSLQIEIPFIKSRSENNVIPNSSKKSILKQQRFNSSLTESQSQNRNQNQIPQDTLDEKTDKRKNNLKVTFGSEQIIYFETDFNDYYPWS